MDSALYLFCFTCTDRTLSIEGTGIDSRCALVAWEVLGITAVFCKVPIEEYAGPQAEVSMKDLSWITPRVCHHQEVIEQVMRHSPVFPARFGTLFSSLSHLEILIIKHREVILSFLEHTKNHEEWAVKGLLDRAKAEQYFFSEQLEQKRNELKFLSPGKQYLFERHVRSNVGTILDCWLSQTCSAVTHDLCALSMDLRNRKLFSLASSGKDAHMVLNCALLMSRTSIQKLHLEIDRLNLAYSDQGLVFELSGPWPPYSFCPSVDSD